MSPALHTVARLIACPPPRAGLAAELSEALAHETGLSIATRLRLVALAARLEAGDSCECSSGERDEPAGWIAALAEAFLRDDASALDALVTHAARLRNVVARAGDRACRLPAAALLELLERRLH